MEPHIIASPNSYFMLSFSIKFSILELPPRLLCFQTAVALTFNTPEQFLLL